MRWRYAGYACNLRAVKLVSTDIIHPGGWQGLESSESTQVVEKMGSIFTAWFLMVGRIILSVCMHTHARLEALLRTIRCKGLELALSSEEAFTPVKREYNVEVLPHHPVYIQPSPLSAEKHLLTCCQATFQIKAKHLWDAGFKETHWVLK